MDKHDIAKTILSSYIADLSEEEEYSDISSDFVRSQCDITDTVPDAIGEVEFDRVIEILAETIVIPKSVESNEEYDEKDIAFYFLGFENDVPENIENQISFDEMKFRDAAYDLIEKHKTNQSK